MTRIAKVVVAFVAWTVATQSHSELIIDDFEVGSITVAEQGRDVFQQFTQFGLDPQHVAGGRRLFELSNLDRSIQTATIANGELRMTGDIPGGGARPVYLNLSYGSTDMPLGLDLIAMGVDRFKVDFNVVPGVARIFVESPGGRVSQGSFFQSIAFGVVQFSKFTGNADFSNVASIRFSAGRSEPFVIRSFSIVPEPDVRELICAALLLVGARRVFRPTLRVCIHSNYRLPPSPSTSSLRPLASDSARQFSLNAPVASKKSDEPCYH